MTQAGDAGRPRKKGAAVVFLLVIGVVAGATYFMWKEAEESSRIPTKEQAARPGGTKWLISSEPLRTTQGFQVIPLTSEDVKAAPRLDDLFASGTKATVIVGTAEYETLREYLAAKLPAGWDDPFGYGIAWRYGNDVVHLSSSQADVI